MSGKINIAIDGPAGAGKSTVAKAVAKRLGILYLDTGAMYRAAALKALRLGIDPLDREKVIAMLPDTDVTVKNEGGTQRTFLDGEDVTGVIRTKEVSKGASDIGVTKEVRMKLAEWQRAFARENDVVMDGREIGSYVLPETKLKFYITASSEERARRRLLELNAGGQELGKTLEQMQREIEARDHTDSTREFAPLRRMPDAVFIDTTDLTAEEATEQVIRTIEGKLNGKCCM